MQDIFGKELYVGDDVLILSRSRNSTEYITPGVVTKIEKGAVNYFCYIEAESRYFEGSEVFISSHTEIKVRDTVKSVYKVNYTEDDKKFIESKKRN